MPATRRRVKSFLPLIGLAAVLAWGCTPRDGQYGDRAE